MNMFSSFQRQQNFPADIMTCEKEMQKEKLRV